MSPAIPIKGFRSFHPSLEADSILEMGHHHLLQNSYHLATHDQSLSHSTLYETYTSERTP
jgi:hypothetical protein